MRSSCSFFIHVEPKFLLNLVKGLGYSYAFNNNKYLSIFIIYYFQKSPVNRVNVLTGSGRTGVGFIAYKCGAPWRDVSAWVWLGSFEFNLICMSLKCNYHMIQMVENPMVELALVGDLKDDKGSAFLDLAFKVSLIMI